MTFKFNEAEQAIVNDGVARAAERAEYATIGSEERGRINDEEPVREGEYRRTFEPSHHGSGIGPYMLNQILNGIKLEVELIRKDDKESYLKKAKGDIIRSDEDRVGSGLYHSTATYDVLRKTTEFRKECGLEMSSADSRENMTAAALEMFMPEIADRIHKRMEKHYATFDPFEATIETVICPNIKAADQRAKERGSR